MERLCEGGAFQVGVAVVVVVVAAVATKVAVISMEASNVDHGNVRPLKMLPGYDLGLLLPSPWTQSATT